MFSCFRNRRFLLRFLIRRNRVRQSSRQRIRLSERGRVVGFGIDHVCGALEQIEDESFVPARETQIGKRLGFDGMQQAPCQRHALDNVARRDMADDLLEVAGRGLQAECSEVLFSHGWFCFSR